MGASTTGLTQLAAPDLSRLSQGGASLQVLEGLGFSADGKTLLVRATFLDDVTGGSLHYAIWTYDLVSQRYTACLNELLAPSGVAASEVEVVSATLVGSGAAQTIVAQSALRSAPDEFGLAIVKGSALNDGALLASAFGVDAPVLVDRYSLSADGRFLALQTDSDKLASDAQQDIGGWSDVYLLDLLSHHMERVSFLGDAQVEASVRLGNLYIRGSQVEVAFSTTAAFVAADKNSGASSPEAQTDAYLWRSAFDASGLSGAATFSLLSKGLDGKASGYVGLDSEVLATAAGVYFSSTSADLVAGDSNAATDVFLSASTGAVQRLSLSGISQLAQGAELLSASSSGRFVSFLSSSPEVAGSQALQQAVVLDVSSGAWQLASASAAGAQANDLVLKGVMSPNGAQLAFTTAADNLSSTPVPAPGGSLFVQATGLSSGVQLDALVYSWKAHTLLQGVTLGVSSSAGSVSPTTGTAGTASVPDLADASVLIQASRTVPADEALATTNAVNLQDAIAILKMIVGLNVNSGTQALSPYQALAADFDGNSRVELNDAIGVLKHVVGLTGAGTPKPEWRFVDEASAAVVAIKGNAALSPGQPPAINVDLTGAEATAHVGLVGYLRGDVDGSFAGASGALDLDVTQPGYFNALVSGHAALNLNLAQFGIYGTF
jgi:hypothetical protein